MNTCTVSGVVIDARGEPAVNTLVVFASVVPQSIDGNQLTNRSLTAVTGSDGTLSISLVRKSLVHVSCMSAGLNVVISVPDADSANLTELVAQSVVNPPPSSTSFALASDLAAESNERQLADEDLQNQIDDLASGGGVGGDGSGSGRYAIESDLRNVESTLTTAITSESSTRQAGDETLTTSIASETQARKNADADLQSQINSLAQSGIGGSDGGGGPFALESAMAAESQARADADDVLATKIDNAVTQAQSALDGESLARQSADGTLSQNLASEAQARQDSDANLQSQIDNLPSGGGGSGVSPSDQATLNRLSAQPNGVLAVTDGSSGTGSVSAGIDYALVVANANYQCGPHDAVIACSKSLIVTLYPSPRNGQSVEVIDAGPSGGVSFVDAPTGLNVTMAWGESKRLTYSTALGKWMAR